ncbi:hypothetical protein G3O08_12760 [Cryomorpha ignava]|uniref:PorT family protein n=1 Tax=Cryomorpha ignava TaxID=101383 RepID=A0A7K3WSD7_9FLAO|nr:hypothetical protein [Cryomorpha ignava]NEN24376.1 hypothetical protein [Cryomorpha ignava]
MKPIFTIFLILFNLTLFSQNVELIGGMNKNKFFDYEKDEGHFNSAYDSQYGYSFQIAIENIRIDTVKWRFTLGYEQYGGSINVRDGGLGGGVTSKAEIDKSIISVGVFPLNFRIIDRIDINVGFEAGALISENIVGTSSGWSIGTNGFSYDLNDKNKRYNAKAYFGLRGRIAYDLNKSDKVAISPQYSNYFGLTKEFDEFPEFTKSMRHFFGLGVQRKIE